MKHARKLTSLLLALVMVFALAVTVAADGGTTTTTGKITVANPVENQTYTAYQIFKVVYDDATPMKHYSYTIENTSEWFSAVETYAADTAHGLTLTTVGDTTNTTTRVVTIDEDKFSAPAFAEALKAAVGDKTGTALIAQADGTASISGLPLGYYFVKSSAADALCNLTTTDPHITIYDKNDMPFEKKVDKTNDDVGKDVTFTIKGKVPNYTGFNKYTYLITDTMTKGLTFKKDVTVTVGGTDVTNACTPTYDVENNANKFTVSIPVKDNEYNIGAEIVVTYTATINKEAIAVFSTNQAKLTYSNDPTTDSTKDSHTEEQKVHTSKIVIHKVEKVPEDAEAKELPDAKFVLYKEVTPEGATEATKVYYRQDDTTKAVTWVDSITNATEVTTGNHGEAFFEGLANGTYYLVETKAPAGYNQLEKPHKVEVAGGTTETALTVTEKVENSAGTLLPSTGGMGTTIFYVLGFVLVVGAGVLLVTKKRMSQGEV